MSLAAALCGKFGRSLLFHPDQVPLASADVYQQAEREGQIRFPREIFDGLLLAVLEEVEVVLFQVPYKRALFRPARKIER